MRPTDADSALWEYPASTSLCGENATGDIARSYMPFPGKPLYPLPLWLLSCGYEQVRSSSYRFNGINRSASVIWQYSLQGAGALTLPDGEFTIRPGQAMLVTTPEEHCYYLPDVPGFWEFIYLTFTGPVAETIAAALRKNYSSILTLAEGGRTVAAAKQFLDHARDRSFQSPYQVAAEAAQFLFTMSEELEATCAGANAEPLFMKRIYAGLLRNPGMEIDGLVAVSGYSRRYLDRRFKEHTGQSPAEFLRHLKLERAAGLLRTSRLSVKEVAAECGFYDATYFCKQFAKQYKFSPATYRAHSGV